MVKLIDVKELIQKVANAISSVLNMDVIISDVEYNKIADTKKHFNLEVVRIKDTYVLSKVIESGDPIIVKGKEFEPTCRECAEKDECNLTAMICTPIKNGQKILGAIALIAISEESRTVLLDKQDNLIEYLDRMSELIISKVMEQEASNNLEFVKNQMVHIINSIADGIITVDEHGFIDYTNSIIRSHLECENDEIIGTSIQKIISDSEIKTTIESNTSFENKETSIRFNGRKFHVMVSGKVIQFENKSAGYILSFKKMSDVYKVVNKISLSDNSISFNTIIGSSKELESVKEMAKQVSDSDSTVLIMGESGTGKELFARAIHHKSGRRNQPFIPLNCAAIPETLLESELFGYEEGAFTGALKGGKLGKFQLAEGGTIFLDEIGDMPIHLQTRLLRVLQEKSIEKIGGGKSIPINVRVIAATNKKLDKLVEDCEFREDLYYRLSVIPLNIPPLRKRQSDIKILIEYFLKYHNTRLNKNILGFEKNIENMLINYQWPGNVRELQNVVEYAVNMEKSSYISIDNIPQRIKNKFMQLHKDIEIQTIEKMEAELILTALHAYEDTYEGKKLVAEALGIGTATLYRKIKKYGLE